MFAEIYKFLSDPSSNKKDIPPEFNEAWLIMLPKQPTATLPEYGEVYAPKDLRPLSIVNAYKNVLAISIGTDYTFELAQKVKDYLANPGAFASAAPAGGAGGDTKAAAAAPVEEEEEEADMDFDLFD